MNVRRDRISWKVVVKYREKNARRGPIRGWRDWEGGRGGDKKKLKTLLHRNNISGYSIHFTVSAKRSVTPSSSSSPVFSLRIRVTRSPSVERPHIPALKALLYYPPCPARRSLSLTHYLFPFLFFLYHSLYLSFSFSLLFISYLSFSLSPSLLRCSAAV